MKELDLSNLQANILKGHGRDHSWNIFLQFNSSQSVIRNWISDLALGKENSDLIISSAEKQNNDSILRKQKENYNGKSIMCFFLSSKGYDKLFFQNGEKPKDESFLLGMKNGKINTKLNDPVSGKWEDNYQERIDAMILLADDNISELAKQQNQIVNALIKNKVGKVLFTEKGKVLRYDDHVIEPFGFRDGITNPKFFTGKGQLNDDWKSFLVNEDHAAEERYGSFFVFRKLEQDVELFTEKVGRLASKLGITRELTEAQIVGRFKDGTPLTLFDDPGKKDKSGETQKRKFDDMKLGYGNDSQGLKCPFHAHIRRTNPRLSNGKKENDKRIIRRGVSYDSAGSGVGTLFMCYQNSIVEKFEFIQSRWSNNKDLSKLSPIYNKENTGIDPISGHLFNDQQAQNWNKEWNGSPNKKDSFDFSAVVNLKGGEYFYAPSIPFLKNLKSGLKKINLGINYADKNGAAYARGNNKRLGGYSRVGIA